jgi:pyruvate dehydrogenase E2 component (dihydrolipoamide acetyltransferase)
VTTTIKLPELGENVDSGELTKILVSAGDRVSKDQALLELETDKATIEVPSPVAGTIKELHVQEGRKIKVGDTLFTIEESGDGAQQKQKAQKEERSAEASGLEASAQEAAAKGTQVVPAAIREERTESERKTEARPAPAERAPARQARAEAKPEPAKPESGPAARPEREEGQRREPKLARVEVSAEAETAREAETPAETQSEDTVIPFRAEVSEQARRPSHLAAASPAIRRFARELGVDINQVKGTGPEGRIDEEDVKNYAREIISRAAGGQLPAGASPALPDFSKWGAVERKPMSSVRRSTAEHLAQAWQNVPQVTQFDSADITDLEILRSRFADEHSEGAAKITVTAIALKVAAAALQKFPQFAASIDMANLEIVYKRYRNIGVAVDTSYGLLVPVVRDVDRKSIPQLARDLAELSERARGKKLGLEEMAGGVFTITNLGGIGGSGFSPIVNYPEVAILGISRLRVEPRQANGGTTLEPRKILPLSLSYDHRLIDGADGARFLRWIAEALEQPALLLFRD